MSQTRRTTRTYDHFCMLARTLERVGDRWTLLIVRDLQAGPRRFTDLMALRRGITPKTLSQRLRELQDAGVVDVDREPGRREAWYRLTPAGEELGPALDALFRWGFRHARRPPMPGEAVHPEHLLRALAMVLGDTPPPAEPLAWHFAFVDDGAYSLAFDGDSWAVTADPKDETPEVTVTTSADAWTQYLMTPQADRPAAPAGIELAGTKRAVQRFIRLLARFPHGVR
jgi:DNA-binding HxlR family transcriptional regulator